MERFNCDVTPWDENLDKIIFRPSILSPKQTDLEQN